MTLTRGLFDSIPVHDAADRGACEGVLQVPSEASTVPAGMGPPELRGCAGAAMAGEGASVGAAADGDAEGGASSIRDREIV